MRLILLLCTLLAVACMPERARGPNADVQTRLRSDNQNLGGLMMLFAATVVEGGGKRGTAEKPPAVVLDVTHEFGAQWVRPGRMKIGRQTVVWAYGGQWDFETPMDGTRIIAFGAESQDGVKVLPDQVFLDTDFNRKVAERGRAPGAAGGGIGLEWNPRLYLFVGSIGIAFAAVFLPWFRVRYGVIALAISIAMWLGYEATIPRQVNIRVDLVVLFPFLIAAIVSTLVAAVDAGKEADPEDSKPQKPRPRKRRSRHGW